MTWALCVLAVVCVVATVALARGGWSASMEESTARQRLRAARARRSEARAIADARTAPEVAFPEVAFPEVTALEGDLAADDEVPPDSRMP
ncbi:MAG: hypothetical protein FWD59_03360 [Micrococcales bacterium]|nr:hypothetical protein [Micrococcales bacterium]